MSLEITREAKSADAIVTTPSARVITPAMVERGAEQLCLNHVSSGAIPWDDLGEVLRDIYRHDVRSVLEAALSRSPRPRTGARHETT